MVGSFNTNQSLARRCFKNYFCQMSHSSESKLKHPLKLLLGILILAIGFTLLTLKIDILFNNVYQSGGFELLLPHNLRWLKFVIFTVLVIGGFAIMASSFSKKYE